MSSLSYLMETVGQHTSICALGVSDNLVPVAREAAYGIATASFKSAPSDLICVCYRSTFRPFLQVSASFRLPFPTKCRFAGISTSALLKLHSSFFLYFFEQWKNIWLPRTRHYDAAFAWESEGRNPNCLAWYGGGQYDRFEEDSCDFLIWIDTRSQLWEDTTSAANFLQFQSSGKHAQSHIHRTTSYAPCHIFFFSR